MAITTYEPDIADADYPSFTGVAFADPAVYGSHSNFRVDAFSFLVPIQNEILAHQAALQALGAGVFEEKGANYTIPDAVVPNTTYAATVGSITFTLPAAADVTAGLIVSIVVKVGVVFIIPKAASGDSIVYGDVTATTTITVNNSVSLQSDGVSKWLVRNSAIGGADGVNIFDPSTTINFGYFVRGTGGGSMPTTGPLVVADFPNNVIETAAINALAVTTAKIDNLAVTTGKIANSAVDLTSKVTGLLPVANQGYALRNITAPTNIVSTDETINDTAGGSTMTLPTAIGAQGKRYTCCNSLGSGSATNVACQVGETVAGGATFNLAVGTFATFASDGSDWIQVG